MKRNLFLSFILTALSLSAFGQKANTDFFNQVDAFFKKNVQQGLVPYADLKSDATLKSLIKHVAETDLTGEDGATKQAFYINAYNLNVIAQAAALYPVQSVTSVGGFFDSKKIKVAGQSLTLNQLEKNNLLKEYGDSRYHFVLVCGALGCPPIVPFAYTPEKLESQLENQSKLALNNPNFVKVDNAANKVDISKIFQWYASDFGGNTKTAVEFINKYRTSKIPASYKVGFYEYDWTLNNRKGSTSQVTPQGGNNASRYVVSAAIPKGSSELKVFNNLYSQRTGQEGNLTDRSTFYTAAISYLYGLNSRFNIGLEARYRHVRNSKLPSSPLEVFTFDDTPTSRQGVTAIGPKVRIAPFKSLKNFSIQSSFVFALGDDLAGGNDKPYIDWNGATWNTQFFNDISIGNNFSLFTEIDVLLEDIGSSEEGHLNRFSTPATLIFSYFPNPKTTLYALGGFSPYWQETFDYFAQAGAGVKYQFTPKVELELLYTSFTNDFLSSTGGKAATYNLGLRFTL